jgi:hypothetical protein
MADFYEGKLVTHRRRPEWGIGLVDGASYTKRFLDEQDREMIAHGMGEYAGSYGGAVNVIFPQAGKTITGIPVRDITVVPPADPQFGEACQ